LSQHHPSIQFIVGITLKTKWKTQEEDFILVCNVDDCRILMSLGLIPDHSSALTLKDPGLLLAESSVSHLGTTVAVGSHGTEASAGSWLSSITE
jgi:hypothetical protein